MRPSLTRISPLSCRSSRSRALFARAALTSVSAPPGSSALTVVVQAGAGTAVFLLNIPLMVVGAGDSRAARLVMYSSARLLLYSGVDTFFPAALPAKSSA